MAETLDADHLTKIIKTGTPADCIGYLAPHRTKDRRVVANVAVTLFKEWDKVRFDTQMDGIHRSDVRDDVARVAVLASASLSAVKSCGWNICPPEDLMVETFTKFRPDWLESWVNYMLDDSPYFLQRIQRVWQEGLCAKPDSESYVLGLVVAPRHLLWPDSRTLTSKIDWKNLDRLSARLRRHPDIFPDLWRFFEVEGHGNLSLAAYDKYSRDQDTWATALRELSEAGLMDRNRLLDASLDALARDFAQFRSGWYSRFFASLKPTQAEQLARKDRFLKLLSSAIPPTVSFALKAIKQIDAASPIKAPELLQAISPVLQARQKGTVKAGLRLIELAAKRAPECRQETYPIVLSALIHEAPDIQAKTLDLLEKNSISDHPEMLRKLSEYVEGLAPSLRSRAAVLCGAKQPVAQVVSSPAKQGPISIQPIESFDAFITEFLHLLEDVSDPLRIERLIDALMRHGADMPSNFEKTIGPLAKRAAQILKSASDTNLRYGLAHLAQCYASQTPPKLPERMHFGTMVPLGYSLEKTNLNAQNFVTVFIKRNNDILVAVQKGLRLPLLAAPSDDRGFVAAKTLIQRIAAYEDAKTPPSPYDLSLALMRLAPEGRKIALKTLKPDNEITRAVSFALGGDLNAGYFNIGKTKWLWVAAAAARETRTNEPKIVSIAGLNAPDVGVVADYETTITKQMYDSDALPVVDVKTSPQITKRLPDTYLSGLFHLTNAGGYYGSACGYNADDIRWSSYVWPQNLEPFFAQGSDVFEAEQKLANSPFAAFIEPMLSSRIKIGPMGILLLCQTLASTDPAVRSLASEILIVGIEENRIDGALFAQTTLDLITKAGMPVARWTKVFGEVFKISQPHAVYLCEVITQMMQFDCAKPPRGIGGLVELLFELHVETGARLSNTSARKCLSEVSSSGKLGMCSKRLLSI